jgi:HD-like signal output (HDOD) protein
VGSTSPKEYLKNISELPSLPAVALQALAVADDPSSTASDLLRVIMSDPPLAAKVLRVANSVHFHRGHDVSDLQTAIVRLGFSNVRNILMGVAVIRSFNGFFAGAPYTREDFWVHSIAVGVTASRLAGDSEQLSSSSSFVMGLLHDIGKLVFDRAAREKFADAVRASREERIPLCEAERLKLGCDHAEVAGALLSAWRFPSELIEPVRWHHDPRKCDAAHRPHAVVLQTADWICNVNRLGDAGNGCPKPPPPESLIRLRVTGRSISSIVQAVENEPLLQLLLPV